VIVLPEGHYVPHFDVWLEKEGKYLIGEREARILDKVHSLGSIMTAARVLGTTYAHAWNVLEQLKVTLGEEVVKARRGGSAGGGTALTERGISLLKEYRLLEGKVGTFLSEKYPTPKEGKLFKVDATPELTIIGSHCIGLEILLRQLLKSTPITYEVANVGSSGGLAAIMLGEADIAGIHLLDEVSSQYNTPFLKRYWIADRTVIIRGYIREQGLIVAKGNPKNITSVNDLLRQDVKIINRELGSGTRTQLDIYIRKIADSRGVKIRDLTQKIKGYETEAMSHAEVAQAVNQGKADVGLGIRAAVDPNLLDFLPLFEEQFDFAIEERRLSKPAISAFLEVLKSSDFKKEIESHTRGIRITKDTGTIIYRP